MAHRLNRCPGATPQWTKKTLDGFGRVVMQEAGYGSTTVSVTETEYAACACSPVGRVKRVSMPRSPQHGNQWTDYQYDALGRTVAVTPPGGKGSKRYTYVDNTVTVTDEADKWKRGGARRDRANGSGLPGRYLGMRQALPKDGDRMGERINLSLHRSYNVAN